MEKHTLKQVLLWALIGSLVLSALIAIFVFIFGEFEETELKLLGTTGLIATFCITSLASSVWFERDKFKGISVLGVLFSVLSLFNTVSLLWEWIDDDEVFITWTLICVILAVAFAHVALLLLAYGYKKSVDRILWGTFGSVVVLSGMLIYLALLLTFEEALWEPEEQFFRALGVFAVLVVLGTLTGPLMKKFAKPE